MSASTQKQTHSQSHSNPHSRPHSHSHSEARPPSKPQEFRITAPTALTVQLVGDFTGWCESPVTLTKGGDGVWGVRISLSPGTHRYRFLVDGEWHDDPDCTVRVPNPFGTQDSVRRVA